MRLPLISVAHVLVAAVLLATDGGVGPAGCRAEDDFTTPEFYGYRSSANQVECDQGEPSEEDKRQYWNRIDLGHVEQLWQSMVPLCTPPPGTTGPASSMKCTSDLSTCLAVNFWVKMGSGANEEFERFGPVGECEWDVAALERLLGKAYAGRLWSWKKEINNNLVRDMSEAPPECARRFNKRVFAQQPDAHANLFHGMCDFIELHKTLHVYNLTHEPRENNAVLVLSHWSQSHLSILYEALAGDTLHTGSLVGQVVCFDELVFALNPRSVYSTIYNAAVPRTLVQNACRARNGRLHLFAHDIKRALLKGSGHGGGEANRDEVRMCVLSRNSGQTWTTGTRHVLNEDAIVAALESHSWPHHLKANVKRLRFDARDKVPFRSQLESVAACDILLGIHGAGLTHLLWLPDWGAVVTLHETKDPLYTNIALERGLIHVLVDESKATRVRSPACPEQHLNNIKFWNFEIEPSAVVAAVDEALARMLAHPDSPFGERLAGGEHKGGAAVDHNEL